MTQAEAITRLWADYQRFLASPAGADPDRVAEVTTAVVLVIFTANQRTA